VLPVLFHPARTAENDLRNLVKRPASRHADHRGATRVAVHLVLTKSVRSFLRTRPRYACRLWAVNQKCLCMYLATTTHITGREPQQGQTPDYQKHCYKKTEHGSSDLELCCQHDKIRLRMECLPKPQTTSKNGLRKKARFPGPFLFL